MTGLVLLLLGPERVRRQWWRLAAFGVLWGLLGIATCADGLSGVLWFPIRGFAVLLLLDGLIALALAPVGIGMQKQLRLVRGAVLVVIALLIIDIHGAGTFILAMLFGLAFVADGALRLAAMLIIRYRGWPAAAVGAIGEMLVGAIVLEPWPTRYAGTVPFCVGIGMMLSAWSILRLARRVRTLTRAAIVANLAGRAAAVPDLPEEEEDRAPVAVDGPLIVHVWTPLGTARDPVSRPIIDRYIGAVDRNGVVSTGHAALEMPPDVYVSHYPAVEIDRSPANFRRVLRATAENDVAGRFLPSYAAEAAGWCPATARVTFPVYDAACVRAYWQAYRADGTYNLTSRNCSGAVAGALDAAMIGAIGRRRHPWLSFLGLLPSSEFWIAYQLRSRAASLTWTPGVVLDYARALSAIVSPPRRETPAG